MILAYKRPFNKDVSGWTGMQENMELWQAAADTIRNRIGENPQSALFSFRIDSLVNTLEQPIEIDYSDIPGFPMTTVKGHAGKLVYGKLGGKQVLIMKGRFHIYEGYDVSQVIFHIRVFKLLGISDLLVTNAAGGINTEFEPGDLMMIKDHISFFAPSPLRGTNLEEFGPRFPDMSNAYDSGLIGIAKEAAREEGIMLRQGIYAFAQGPMFETPAEIRALRMLGADAVGMSTVPEVIVARHCGMKVMGISCITNMAAGVKNETLNHEEVMETADRVGKSFSALVRRIIANWPV